MKNIIKYLILLSILVILPLATWDRELFTGQAIAENKSHFLDMQQELAEKTDRQKKQEKNTEADVQNFYYHDHDIPPLVMMVRTLKYLQDDLAKGEAKVIQKQEQILHDIARTVSTADLAIFENEKNLQALITYLFSGGNAKMVANILHRLPIEKQNQPFIKGVIAHLLGHHRDLARFLTESDTSKWSKDLYFSVLLGELGAIDPKLADKNLDYIRLSAPGTLFEEAAIRRQINISGYLGNVEKIRLLSRNYINRFPNSAYINSFWNEFVRALQLTESKMSDEELTSIIDLAPPKIQYLTYLYLARTALLNGKTQRARYSAIEANRLGRHLNILNPSVFFYYAASQVGSISAVQAGQMLRSIGLDTLENKDRLLYEVALRVAESIQFSLLAEKRAFFAKRKEGNIIPQDSEREMNLPFLKKDPFAYPMIKSGDFDNTFDTIDMFLTATQEKISK